MKKLIFIAAIFAATSAQAQTIQQDASGNFFQVKASEVAHDSTTTRTFTDAKGKTEPVYKGAKGSFYLARTSKAGNYYRKYLSSGTATFGQKPVKQ